MKSTLLISLLMLIHFNILAFEDNKTDSLIDVVQTIQYNNPDSGIILLEKAIENLAEKKELSFAWLHYHLAYIYYMKGEYPTAQNKYLVAYHIFDSLDSEIGKAKTLNGRGLIYLGRELYQEAITLFEKAMVVNTTIKNKPSISSNYLNIGICYYKLNDSKKAFQNLHKALNLAISNENYLIKTMSLNHLGHAHLNSKSYDSAQFYFNKIELDSEASQWEKAFAFTGLAEVYLAKENYQEAIKTGETGLRIAKELNAKWDIAQITKVLSQAYEKNNQYKKALEFANFYKVYSDSLLNEAKNREISEIELQQSRLENEKLSSEKELIAANAKFYRYANFGLILLLLIFIGVAFLFRKYAQQKSKYYRQLNDLNKQIISHKNQIEEQNIVLNELNQSKNRLFSILSHDLRSPMISIQQLLELNKENKIAEKDNKSLLNMLEKQVGNVNAMLNDLLNWANTQMDGLQTQPKNLNLTELVHQNITTLQFISTEKQISIHHKNTDNIGVFADLGHTKIIISNLLNNAIKFTPPNGQIEVFYTETPPYHTLHIKDNGIGMNSNTRLALLSKDEKRSYSRSGTKEEIGTGLGLLIVKQFANSNNAKLEIDSTENEGTTFSVSFLKSEASSLN